MKDFAVPDLDDDKSHLRVPSSSRRIGLPIGERSVIPLAEDLDYERTIIGQEIDPTAPLLVADVDLSSEGKAMVGSNLVEARFEI